MHTYGPLALELGVWFDVRNTVAHEGACRPAPVPTRSPATRQRTPAAFELAGRGDLDRGSQRYAEACAAGAEVVLRPVALGRPALS
jgi:hypothetical protein